MGLNVISWVNCSSIMSKMEMDQDGIAFIVETIDLIRDVRLDCVETLQEQRDKVLDVLRNCNSVQSAADNLQGPLQELVQAYCGIRRNLIHIINNRDVREERLVKKLYCLRKQV